MSSNESSQVARATSLIQPIADDFGCELVDVDYNNGVLRVIIDEPEGLNSQTLVDVTKAVSRMIDAEDPIAGRFTLEITSPGVERPLKKPMHFQRSIGESILVKTRPGAEIAGERRAEGLLSAADEYGITLTIDGHEHTLAYGQIRSARTVFAWGPTPKKGGKQNQDNTGSKNQNNDGSKNQNNTGSQNQNKIVSKNQNNDGSKNQDNTGSQNQNKIVSKNQNNDASKKQPQTSGATNAADEETSGIQKGQLA